MKNSISSIQAANPNSVLDTMAQITCSNIIDIPLASLDHEDNYVLTMYLKSFSSSSFKIYMQIDMDNEIELLGSNINSTWSKEQIKFKGVPGSKIYIELPAGTYYIYNPKLETGTIETAYSQNQIDFKQMVESLSANIEVSIGKITQTVTDEITRVNGLEKTVEKQGSITEQTAEKINNKVWKEDIDGKYIAAQINISPEDVIIEAKHINLKGAVTLSAFSDELKDTFNSMVKSVKTEYAESNSNQIAPTSGWSENAPAYNKDKYIWQKTTTTFSNGNSISSNPTCISGYNGVDGKDGADGANGISVSSIIPLYYASNSNAAPSIDKNTSIYNDSTVGRWTTVQPDFNKNYKYIYVCSKITYSNGTVQFSTVTQENVLTRLVQWCKENDVTKIDGANIYTGSIAADAIDVNDLFAQNIKATGTIEGAKLKGTSIEGRSQIVIFNPNNGNKRIGIYNESVNKYAQMNDYSGIIHINGDYAGWIVGGQLCLGKYTGSYTEGEISKLSIDFENGIILQGNTNNPWGQIGGKDIILSGDNGIQSFQNKGTYLEIATTTGTKGINWWNSDTRLKKNIEDTDIDNAIEIVDKIKHHKFDWKDERIKSVKLGYLAHELQEIDEDLVFAVKQNEGSEYDELLQIDETHLIPYLSKAIQELYSIVKEQHKAIDNLKGKINYADNKDVN